MERPRLSRAIGRLVWGGDSGRYYESMDAVAQVPRGGTVVDCPCGAGPAFRAIPRDGSIRYVAADLSPSMLRRARKRARLRGLTGLEIVEADATALPLPADSADLFLTFWGLHCYDDPAGALAEAARVLKPGGAPGRRQLRPRAREPAAATPGQARRRRLRPGWYPAGAGGLAGRSGIRSGEHRAVRPDALLRGDQLFRRRPGERRNERLAGPPDPHDPDDRGGGEQREVGFALVSCVRHRVPRTPSTRE